MWHNFEHIDYEKVKNRILAFIISHFISIILRSKRTISHSWCCVITCSPGDDQLTTERWPEPGLRSQEHDSWSSRAGTVLTRDLTLDFWLLKSSNTNHQQWRSFFVTFVFSSDRSSQNSCVCLSFSAAKRALELSSSSVCLSWDYQSILEPTRTYESLLFAH